MSKTGQKHTPPYRQLDHTADLRIEVFGKTLEELFENGAIALFATIADTSGLQVAETRVVAVAGCDLADLMFNWLREILSVWSVETRLVVGVSIERFGGNEVVARVSCTQPLSSDDLWRVRHEIKAVTYHSLCVEKRGGRWVAQVVFDV